MEESELNLPNIFGDRLSEDLNNCKDFGDIFSIVKRAVRVVLGLGRAGLMLYVGDIRPNILAYHILGTNAIVINRRAIRAISRSTFSTTEFNSTLFLIVLHEYLHSLGYVDEQNVRELVYKVSKVCFGKNHPVTEKALVGPEYGLRLYEYAHVDDRFILVKDFEKTEQRYIC